MTSSLRSLLLCAVGAFGGYSLFELTMGAEAPAPGSAPLASTETSRAVRARSDGLETARSLELRTLPEVAAEQPPAAADGATSIHLEPWRLEPLPIRVPEGRFEKRYAGWGVEELDATYAERMNELGFDCMTAFRERHQAGLSLWREFENTEDTDGDGIADAAPAIEVRGSAEDLFVMAGTDHYGGEIRPYVVWLPADQYPELYELRDELTWLKRERASRGGGSVLSR